MGQRFYYCLFDDDHMVLAINDKLDCFAACILNFGCTFHIFRNRSWCVFWSGCTFYILPSRS